MKKLAFWMIFTIGVLSLITISLYKWEEMTSASANPDYICVKDVTWWACEVTSCWAWGTDWTRVCQWRKATQVSYYLVRTSCEPWYTRIGLWWDNGGASWRHTADYVSKWEDCSITQVDNVAPAWNIWE